ncbi:MAG: DUF3846 domain-containing protein [Lachnospiraceae bacterium]|nr:DUF3846 domain-containing protein [Lachnospiraceae bacterium]
MKEYDVTIKETLEKTVSMKADSKEEAEEKVRQGYYNSEYVLDADNFSDVDFKSDEGREITREGSKLDVLLVKPGKAPVPYQVGSELEDLQATVGGDIEDVYLDDEDVGIICNEQGKNIGLSLNRALRDADGQMYDILTGDFLVVGLGEEDYCSLTPEQMEKYEKRFHYPETFVKMGRSIMALPIRDEPKEGAAKEKSTDAKRAQPSPVSL